MFNRLNDNLGSFLHWYYGLGGKEGRDFKIYPGIGGAASRRLRDLRPCLTLFCCWANSAI